MDDYSFTLPGADEHQRRAFRATVPGLEAYVPHLQRSFPIKDLSAMGMGLHTGGEAVFKEGDDFDFDLMLNRKVYLGELRARVMRIARDSLVGCSFEAMDKRKEAKLDKLVLEVQKRFIALRKAQQEKE